MPPPCNHDPVKARQGEPFDPAVDCRLCHHWLHRPDYRAAWEKSPPRAGRTAPAPPAPAGGKRH